MVQKSEPIFFLTQKEYHSVKTVVSLKNFTRVPNETGFMFYTKKI